MSARGEVNIAPMGPHVQSDMSRFQLRPFRSAQTYKNLREHPEGVFHIVDDVLLLARAALGTVSPLPPLKPAEKVHGHVLADACRLYEFQVRSVDDQHERSRIDVDVVHTRSLREFVGFNRAKHAVVEAAIMATRTDFLPLHEINAEYAKLSIIVDKTGGRQEKEAFAFLADHLDRVAKARGEAVS